MNSIQSALVRFLIRRSGMWNKPLGDIRKSLEGIKGKGIPLGVKVSRELVNNVPYELFESEGAKQENALLYFHGGGFCMGIYNPNREFAAGISKRAGVNVYMPDYRLAPEQMFPAALEDAVAFYKGILHKGYDAKRLIVMGDSSGCALALSALLVLRQGGIEMPKALVFMTPVFDFVGNGESFSSRAGKDPFKMKDPLGIAKKYIGDNNPHSPMISPLYGELDGMPPVLLHAGDYDVFRSDAFRFAEKVKAAGGTVELKTWEKMWHIFHMQAAMVPEASKAIEELCSYIRISLQD